MIDEYCPICGKTLVKAVGWNFPACLNSLCANNHVLNFIGNTEITLLREKKMHIMVNIEADMKNKKEKDETRVVGVRCSELKVEPLPGSWKTTCCECKKDVWVTKMWKGKKIYKIMCNSCCFDKGIYKGEDVQLKVTKETLDEFVQWAREYFGDQIKDKSDEDIKFDAIELIENKTKKEIKVAKLQDLN